MSKPVLSSEDVRRLLEDPNDEARAATVAKVADSFNSNDMSEKERLIATDIFRTLMRDVATQVRSALSESLKENPDVPHDVALSLAKDVEEVALPMIEQSDVLTDADLIDIVKSSGAGHSLAVAGRSTVSPGVSEALVDSGHEKAVVRLMANDGAEITEGVFDKALTTYSESEAVTESMAKRGELPVRVAERLLVLVSDTIRDHIMTHHEISPTAASDLLMESREKALVAMVEGQERQTVLEMIDELARNNRLTETLVIRSLLTGDLTFFEAALARLSGLPIPNVHLLVHDAGGAGLARLFQKLNFPEGFLPMAKAALAVSEEMMLTAGDDKALFRQVMIERVLTALEDDVDTGNLDYLVSKLVKDTPQQAMAH